MEKPPGGRHEKTDTWTRNPFLKAGLKAANLVVTEGHVQIIDGPRVSARGGKAGS